MSAYSVSLRHFILGLLAQQPMSGYDIKRVLTRLDWLIGNPSFGSLYPALHALHKDGLVIVDVDVQQDRPSRKVYSITEEGRKTLKRWINRCTGENASTKAFVMRLMLADSFSRAGLITQLQQRRVQVITQCDALRETAALGDDGKQLGQRLAQDYGLVLANSELLWLERALDRLLQQPLSTENARGDRPNPDPLGLE